MSVRVYTWMLPPLINLGLQLVLQHRRNCTYVGSYEDKTDLTAALAAPHDTTVDVLLMDYQMQFDDYPVLLQSLKHVNPNLRILFLIANAHGDAAIIRALRSGGDAYLLQSVTVDVLLRALDEIADGRSYLHSQVTPIVLAELRKPMAALHEADVRVHLTERERLLIQLAADGLSSTQISDVLGIAEKTVRNLWSAVFDKIGMNDRTQAVLWAIRTGQAELR